MAIPTHMLPAHGNAKGRFCGPMPPMRSGRDGLAKAWDNGWPRLEAGTQIGTMPRRRLASAGLRAKVGFTLGPWHGASTGRSAGRVGGLRTGELEAGELEEGGSYERRRVSG